MPSRISGAPRLWMMFDPQCSFSVRAMQAFQALVTSGRVQFALIPVSILDHEDNCLSTKAALSLLSLPPAKMAEAWSSGQDQDADGHWRPRIGRSVEAGLRLEGVIQGEETT